MVTSCTAEEYPLGAKEYTTSCAAVAIPPFFLFPSPLLPEEEETDGGVGAEVDDDGTAAASAALYCEETGATSEARTRKV